MQMNHPLWPVVRESARRVVRIQKISITAPEIFSSSIVYLTGLIRDNIPQRITFPLHQSHANDEVWIYDNTDTISKPIVYIGDSEPPIEICWIEMPIELGFSALMESCEQLLNAGYPGCVGCDESIPEGRWDEGKFRVGRKNN